MKKKQGSKVTVLKEYLSREWRTLKQLNTNTRLIIIISSMVSILEGALLTPQMLLAQALGASYTQIGLIVGTAMAPAAFCTVFSGWLADRWRKDAVISIGGLFGIVGIILKAFSFNLATLWAGVMFAWAGMAFILPTSNAILADNSSKENRDEVFSLRFIAHTTALPLGTLITALVFIIIGNQTSASTLRIVMMIGLIPAVIGLICSLFLDDRKALEKVQKGKTIEAALSAAKPLRQEDKIINEERKDEPREKDEEELADDPLAKWRKSRVVTTLVEYRNPIILILSGALVGFGAGVSVKFVSNLLVNVWNLSPAVTQLLQAITYPSMGILSFIFAKLAKKQSRVLILIVPHLISIISVVGVVFVPPTLGLIAFMLFGFREILMTAGNPLIHTMIQEGVGLKRRGLWGGFYNLAWNLLNAIAGIIGGSIIDHLGSATGLQGYQIGFIITCVFYGVSTLVLIGVKDSKYKELREAKRLKRQEMQQLIGQIAKEPVAEDVVTPELSKTVTPMQLPREIK